MAAATYYISPAGAPTGVNGTYNGSPITWGVGSDSYDSTQAQNPATPWATLGKVRSAGITTDPNTIVLNDGTYVAPSGATLFVFDYGTALTLIAANNRMAYITAYTTQTAYVVSQQIATVSYGASATSGNVVLYGRGNTNDLHQYSGVGPYTTNFNGTWFKDFLVNAVTGATSTASMNANGWYASTTTPNTAAVFYTTTTLAAGTSTIINGSCDITSTGAAKILYGVNLISTSPAHNAVMYGNTFNFIASDAALNTAAFRGAELIGMTTTLAYNNKVVATGALHGIGIWDEAGVPTSTSCKIYNNDITLSANTTSGSGYGIGVGGEDTTNQNKKNNVLVYGNTVTGANHGVWFGYISDARAWGNTVSNSILGHIMKGCTNSKMEGVIATNISADGFSFKGATNCEFDGTLYINDSSDSAIIAGRSMFRIYADNVGPLNSTGCKFTNNIIYSPNKILDQVVIHEASQTITFANNDYYSPLGFAASAFVVSGSNVPSGTFIGTNDPTGKSVDPLFSNFNKTFSSADYRLLSTSTLLSAGKIVSGAKDFRGRTRLKPPAIGPYEPTSGDVVTLARAARA